MSNVQSLTATAPRSGLGWRIALWSAQILLAAFYGFAGALKTFMSPDELPSMGLNYAMEIPYLLLLFIGVCELAGAAGVLLPALTRTKPWLTPLAAFGFVVLQVLAIGFHLSRGETEVLPMNVIALAVAAFVVWGRVWKAPTPARARLRLKPTPDD
jgi:uncharacterized membrane protein YphA (DoxX/SURF4 family)